MTRAAQHLLRCLRLQADRSCSSAPCSGNTLPVAAPLTPRAPPVQLMDGQSKQDGEGLTIGASAPERSTDVTEFDKSVASSYHLGAYGSRCRAWEPAGDFDASWFHNPQLPGGTTGTSQPLRDECWPRNLRHSTLPRTLRGASAPEAPGPSQVPLPALAPGQGTPQAQQARAATLALPRLVTSRGRRRTMTSSPKVGPRAPYSTVLYLVRIVYSTIAQVCKTGDCSELIRSWPCLRAATKS